MKNAVIKAVKIWIGSLVWIVVLFAAIPPGWAEEDYESLDIIIHNMDFKLDDISLKELNLVLPVGVALSFMNVDPLITSSGLEGLMPHLVIINDQDGKELARSPLMNKAEHSIFYYKFNQPGLYTYGCLIHPFMRGKVITFDVQAGERAQVQ